MPNTKKGVSGDKGQQDIKAIVDAFLNDFRGLLLEKSGAEHECHDLPKSLSRFRRKLLAENPLEALRILLGPSDLMASALTRNCELSRLEGAISQHAEIIRKLNNSTEPVDLRSFLLGYLEGWRLGVAEAMRLSESEGKTHRDTRFERSGPLKDEVVNAFERIQPCKPSQVCKGGSRRADFEKALRDLGIFVARPSAMEKAQGKDYAFKDNSGHRWPVGESSLKKALQGKWVRKATKPHPA